MPLSVYHGCICSCSGPWRAWDATPHPVVLRRVSASGPGLPSALQAGAASPLGMAECELGRVSAPSWFHLGPQGSAPLAFPSLAWSTCFRDFQGKAVRISCLPPSGRRRLPGPQGWPGCVIFLLRWLLVRCPRPLRSDRVGRAVSSMETGVIPSVPVSLLCGGPGGRQAGSSQGPACLE